MRGKQQVGTVGASGVAQVEPTLLYQPQPTLPVSSELRDAVATRNPPFGKDKNLLAFPLPDPTQHTRPSPFTQIRGEKTCKNSSPNRFQRHNMSLLALGHKMALSLLTLMLGRSAVCSVRLPLAYHDIGS